MAGHALDVQLRGQQLLALGRVDPVEAGMRGGRRRDAHVDRAGAGGAHHLHDLERGGAADDGIVHQHDPLARQHGPVGVVLQLDPQVADLLARLDEGPPDVVVADDPQLEGDPRLLGVADGGRHPGIGHRYDHVGVHVAFPRQLGADALAGLVDALALHHRIGPGEIDMLEDAEAARHLRKGP